MADFRRIEVLDVNGAAMLRWLKLDDEAYYGGITGDHYLRCVSTPAGWGPHTLSTTALVLDTLAELARQATDLAGFKVEGQGPAGEYAYEMLGRRMHAGRLAAVLGIDFLTVREHFGTVVLVDDPESPCDGICPAMEAGQPCQECRKDGAGG